MPAIEPRGDVSGVSRRELILLLREGLVIESGLSR